MDFLSAVLWLTLRVADLHAPRISESVTVVSRASAIVTPSAVTSLGIETLQGTPAQTLDDALRSVPGFSLFRRSSSRAANPTTQGATLRGLAASGSSRALVLADNVALNDPVGGWVYWNRIPLAALQQVSVARGAAGDLHGADALAGVIDIRTADATGVRLLTEGGTHGTARVSGFAQAAAGPVRISAALEGFTTDGFITVAPESRGPVDSAASSRHRSAHVAAMMRERAADVTVRASHFAESRRNGTPIQQNATSISQLSSALQGLLGTTAGWLARAYLATQTYEQTFSAVSAGRTTERQTSAQVVGADVREGQGDYWWHSARRRVDASVRLNARHVTARLEDAPFNTRGEPLAATIIDAKRSTLGVAARAAYRAARFETGGGLRLERSTTGDVVHVVPSPRLWVTLLLADSLRFTAALQSGFRVPTINELHRPFRVGNVLTNANAALAPERARGVEGGVVWHRGRLTSRALLFWTDVDDAIVNVTTAGRPELIERQRQNAGRISAAGSEVEFELRAFGALAFTGSSVYTHSRFSEGPLAGLRVPQVARLQHAVGVRFTGVRLRASADWRYAGRQFDDDRNAFPLDASAMVDARVGCKVTRRVELFAATENLLDVEQDVGRTPLRTTGIPRMSRVGLRFSF